MRPNVRALREWLGVCSLAGTLGVTPTALAGPDAPQFLNRVLGVPDFDQRRMAFGLNPGLPLNGINYCVPTSHMNWLGFVANRGYPEIAPGGPTNWNRATGARYFASTVQIDAMGAMMSTSATTGTTVTGEVFGLLQWLSVPPTMNYTRMDFSVSANLLNDGVGIFMDWIGWAMVRGGLVSLHVGWYQMQGDGTFLRTGGHVVSLVQFVGAGPANNRRYAIGINDPGSDENDLTRQSPFTMEQYRLSPQTVMIPAVDSGPIVVWRVDNYASGATVGFIDGYTTLFPQQALTWDQNDQLSLINTAVLATEGVFPPSVPLSPEIVTRNNFAMQPYTSRVAHFTHLGGDWYVQQTGLGNDNVLLAGITLTDPDDLVASRFGRLYVVDAGGSILCINPETQTLENVIGAGENLVAITCRDSDDRLFVLDAFSRTIDAYDLALNSIGSCNLANVPFQVQAGDRLAVSPVTGHVWILHAGAGFATELALDPENGLTLLQSWIALPAGGALSIAVTDQDRVVVGFPAATHEYQRSKTNEWEPVIGSVYSKLPGRFVGLTASRNNINPAIHLGPGWDTEVAPDVFAAPILACAADINTDGYTNGADLSVLLAQFGGMVAEEGDGADMNADGQVNGADLSVLLSDFGCEPPPLPSVEE